MSGAHRIALRPSAFAAVGRGRARAAGLVGSLGWLAQVRPVAPEQMTVYRMAGRRCSSAQEPAAGLRASSWRRAIGSPVGLDGLGIRFRRLLCGQPLGSALDRLPQLPTTQESAVQLCPAQPGVLQPRFVEVGALQLRLLKVCVLQLRATQIGALQLRPLQMSVLQLYSLQPGA